MPNTWKKYKLEDVCSKITDGSHSSPKVLKNGSYFMASVKDMDDFGFNLENCKRISESDFRVMEKSGCRPESNDILFSKDGTIGQVILYRQNLDLAVLSSIAIIRPNQEIVNPSFLSYLLKNPSVNNYIKLNYKSGSALPRVILKEFRSHEVTLPTSLKEQQAIAEILSALDDKIELNLQTNKTLEEMAMTLYKHRFVDNSVEVDNLPLSEVLEFIVDNRGKTAPTAESGVPLIATNCVKNHNIYPTYDKVRFIDAETYESWFRAHPIPGDILFVNKGLPGSVNLVPDPVDFCIAQDMVALRVNPKIISNYYLFAYLRQYSTQIEILNKSVGTTIPHLKKTDLLNFEIPVPEKKLIEEYTENVSPIYDQLDILRKESISLTQIRDYLLPKLISGEIRVKKDPLRPTDTSPRGGSISTKELI